MKTKLCHYLLCLMIFIGMSFTSGIALAVDSAGVVLMVADGAWVERGGAKKAITVKDTIQVNDIVSTDAHGKVQIIFHDDTLVAIGNNSSVTISAFVFGGAQKPSFSTQMAQGVARFVTGKVVEQNREGFSVKTPNATVGIRGTTFAVEISPTGVTDITGLSINPALPISVTNLTTGTVDIIDKNGLAVKAATVGNTRYMAPAGKLATISEAVEISASQAESVQPSDSQPADASAQPATREEGASEKANSSDDEGDGSDSGEDSGAAGGGKSDGGSGSTRSVSSSASAGSAVSTSSLGGVSGQGQPSPSSSAQVSTSGGGALCLPLPCAWLRLFLLLR